MLTPSSQTHLVLLRLPLVVDKSNGVILNYIDTFLHLIWSIYEFIIEHVSGEHYFISLIPTPSTEYTNTHYKCSWYMYFVSFPWSDIFSISSHPVRIVSNVRWLILSYQSIYTCTILCDYFFHLFINENLRINTKVLYKLINFASFYIIHSLLTCYRPSPWNLNNFQIGFFLSSRSLTSIDY